MLFALPDHHKNCWDWDFLLAQWQVSAMGLQNKATLFAGRREIPRDYQQINDNSIPRVFLGTAEFIRKRS